MVWRYSSQQANGFAGFKIYQDGLDSQRRWGVNRLVQKGGKFSFKIPSCIEAGQYLLRAELIALHGASNYPGAQLYMECAQLNIRGGGNKKPPTVSFPGAYKPTDPGIKINVSRLVYCKICDAHVDSHIDIQSTTDKLYSPRTSCIPVLVSCACGT